jgi:hypothetical protein
MLGRRRKDAPLAATGGALVGVVEPRPGAVAAIETSARQCVMRGETD